jgi:hypothetical protein
MRFARIYFVLKNPLHVGRAEHAYFISGFNINNATILAAMQYISVINDMKIYGKPQ